MGAEFMVKYRRFSAIHLASHMRIVWCPACHCGVVPSAAAAAATRRPSVVPAPDVPALTRGGGAGSYLRGLWGEGTPAPAGEGAGGEAMAPRRRPSLCIGCPGCQRSLCLSCRALHAPGVDCTAAAAVADAANAADANGGVWTGGGDEVGGDWGSAGGGREGASMAAASGESQEAGVPHEPEQCTKRCPSCHVPIFKDGECGNICRDARFLLCALSSLSLRPFVRHDVRVAECDGPVYEHASFMILLFSVGLMFLRSHLFCLSRGWNKIVALGLVSLCHRKPKTFPRGSWISAGTRIFEK